MHVGRTENMCTAQTCAKCPKTLNETFHSIWNSSNKHTGLDVHVFCDTRTRTHCRLRCGLLVVIEGMNYEWVEPIIINYSLFAFTLSSCCHCGCQWVYTSHTKWVMEWWVVLLIGAQLQVVQAGESLSVKSLWDAELTLVQRRSGGCWNKRQPDNCLCLTNPSEWNPLKCVRVDLTACNTINSDVSWISTRLW